MTPRYTLILAASEMPNRLYTFLLSQLRVILAFCKSVVHLVIHDDRLREGAAKEGELVCYLQSLFLDGNVELYVGVTMCWLLLHFCLFMLVVRPNLPQAIENLSTVFCMLALIVASSAQSSGNSWQYQSSRWSLKPSKVEDRTVSAVWNADSIIWVTKCIKQHRKKYDT